MSRGKAQKSLDLIDAAHEILVEIQPASVRGVCYRLFTMGLIDSMAKSETNKVSTQLTWAREHGIIPWAWIVDETRDAERDAVGWENPEHFSQAMLNSYRRDAWTYQSKHIEIWSEKGTVRGILAPVLQDFGLAFRVMHGYASSTAIYQAAQESLADAKDWLVLYCGDYDPSGMHMSEVDLPARLAEYGAMIEVQRVALTTEDVLGGNIPSFDTDSKAADPRYRWYHTRYGERSWELDALSPPILRDRLAATVTAGIEPEAWERCRRGEEAEQETLKLVLGNWHSSISRQASKCGGGR